MFELWDLNFKFLSTDRLKQLTNLDCSMDESINLKQSSSDYSELGSEIIIVFG